MDNRKLDIEIRTGCRDLPYDQVISLYDSVGWQIYTEGEGKSRLRKAIENSSYVASAWTAGRLIGLARCLPDYR